MKARPPSQALAGSCTTKKWGCKQVTIMFITAVSPYRALDYESEEPHCGTGHAVYVGSREILFRAALHLTAPKDHGVKKEQRAGSSPPSARETQQPGAIRFPELRHSKKPPTEGADTWKTDLCLPPEAAFPPSSSFSWM